MAAPAGTPGAPEPLAQSGVPDAPAADARSISCVIPCYNEAANLRLMLPLLEDILWATRLRWEIIVVDDGSTDDTAAVAEAWCELAGFRCVSLSRNFGKEAALTAGLAAATGDAVVLLDGDLQHSPELIHAMLAQWTAGAEVVYAVRQERSDESRFKQFGSKLFYNLVNSSDRFEVPKDAGDFRLMDRAVVTALGDMARATVFNLDPAAQARDFEAQGFEYLHVVDLDGAFAGKPVNAGAVEAMLKTVKMPVQLGGGIRDLATVEAWLSKGITRVIIGTAAVRDPALVKEAAQKFPGRVAADIYGIYLVIIPVYAFLILPWLMAVIGQTKGYLSSVALFHWGLMTCVYNIGYAAFLMRTPADQAPAGAAGLVFFLLVATEFNDVAQYVWGKLFGRNKIIPRVSPNKTWEGFLGGWAR
eukprot:gene38271-51690_t